MGYETLYHCREDQAIKSVREFLERMYGIKDKDSLLETCMREYNASTQYEQFMTFWKRAPLFDVNELNEQGRKGFEKCKMIAAFFYPFLQEKGFYAWDINERIGLCRVGVAAELLTEEEFWQVTDPWVRQAQVFYDSYEEYALSALGGALYYMGRYQEDIQDFLKLNMEMIEHLLSVDGAWGGNKWYKSKEREWAPLIPNNMACLVTKRALSEEHIGYMYREEPNPDHPDSGWRFFIGNEEDEYISNPENITVCGLNTICNLNPEIIAFINAESGRRFGRYNNG